MPEAVFVAVEVAGRQLFTQHVGREKLSLDLSLVGDFDRDADVQHAQLADEFCGIAEKKALLRPGEGVGIVGTHSGTANLAAVASKARRNVDGDAQNALVVEDVADGARKLAEIARESCAEETVDGDVAEIELGFEHAEPREAVDFDELHRQPLEDVAVGLMIRRKAAFAIDDDDDGDLRCTGEMQLTRKHQAVAAVIAAATENGDTLFVKPGNVALKLPENGDPSIFHEHQRGDPPGFDGGPIELAHFFIAHQIHPLSLQYDHGDGD